VVGVSLGGMIAQELALRHPEAVTRLVLAGTRPPAPAYSPPPTDVIASMLTRPARGETLDQHYRNVWTSYAAEGFAEREPAVVDELVAQLVFQTTPRAAVMNQLRAIAGWHSSTRLGLIDAPTVVVHGESDAMCPPENGRTVARLIRGADYLELPNVGHLIPHEAPRTLNEIILNP
jgi:pimeloyl-ACP methyl ester carboxylesterase